MSQTATVAIAWSARRATTAGPPPPNPEPDPVDADALARLRAKIGSSGVRCLELGLLGELWLDLVPVLLDSGVRFFEELKAAPILLDGPDLLFEGSHVTHLRCQVRRS